MVKRSNSPKIIFLGATNYSDELLNLLINEGFDVQAVFTIPEEFDISYSERKVKNHNYADLRVTASQHKIPCYEVESGSGKTIVDYQEIITQVAPDLILVLGWYYMVPEKVRELARFGAWGIHASMLPKYAGGAPLVWAIIEGQNETGVTLFKLSDGVDDGDIIRQIAFPILEDDTIKTVYDKATEASGKILLEVLGNIDHVTFSPQDKNQIKVYPQRGPEDGKIDWSWDSKRIKDFIRAQTKPYPGAFTIINGKKITIWDADILDLE